MIYRRFLLEVEEKSSPVNIKKSNNFTNSNEEQTTDNIETDPSNEDDINNSSDEDTDTDIDTEMDETSDNQIEEDPESYIVSYKKFFLIQKLNELKGRLEEKGLGLAELNTILLFVSDLSYETLLLLTMRILTMVKNYIKESKNNDKIKTK